MPAIATDRAYVNAQPDHLLPTPFANALLRPQIPFAIRPDLGNFVTLGVNCQGCIKIRRQFRWHNNLRMRRQQAASCMRWSHSIEHGS
jgi:hypothetical protein